MSTEVKCQRWSVTTMLSELANMHQGDNKRMVVHCEKFVNAVDVMEGQWGESHPQKVAKKESDCDDNTKCEAVTDKCNRKFLACLKCDGQKSTVKQTVTKEVEVEQVATGKFGEQLNNWKWRQTN